LAALALAGCSWLGADKSGGSGPARVLVLANNNDDGLVGAPAVARFVEQVDQLSHGRLQVRVASGWRGGGGEARLIRDVGRGDADLGWSGTRAFDLVGVNAFEPLHAPFLVSSYAVEAAVVRDPAIQATLTSVRPLGLVGLALAADELRMPAAAVKPLLTPSDFRGRAIGTFPSKVQTSGLAALGAQPATVLPPRPPVTSGLDAIETSWGTYDAQAQYGAFPYVTANAALWPRTEVIFANATRWDRLDATARGWLRQAGAEAATWSSAHAQDAEAAQIRRVCGFGARLATATPTQLVALRAAASQVYSSLATDADLGRTLARLEALAETIDVSAGAPIPPGCAYRPGEEKRASPPARTLDGPGRPGALPQGVYRYVWTHDELIGIGLSEHDAQINAAVVTWTVNRGQWSSAAKLADSRLKGRPGAYTSCQGWYDVDGDSVAFTTTTHYSDGDCAPATWTARWSVRGRILTWSAVNIPDFVDIFTAKPWVRIG
jgi:TRAP-type C4-dicarboxylate transport system substrate-binding protein